MAWRGCVPRVPRIQSGHSAVDTIGPVNAPRYVSSTSGVDVALHDLGGDGPIVLFAHATGFHGRCYEPVAAALADRFHCFAVDLRGHGDSKFPDGLDLAWSGMGEDLLAVKAELSPAGPLLAVGHSMGGASILLAEAQAPGTFASAWVFEPIVFPPQLIDPNGSPLVLSARKRREVFDSFDAVIERYGSRPPFDRVDPRALRAYVHHGFRSQDDGTVILKCRGEIEAQVFENSNNQAWDRLPDIELPVAVGMSGDGGAPASVGAPIAEALANGSLLMFDDLTHFGPFEAPERIAESIADWFAPST